MSIRENSASSEADKSLFGDPDCVQCLHTKLRATSVVVFFQTSEGWRLGNYQDEKPSDHAEIDFYCMLRAGVPEKVAAHKKGLVFSDDDAIAEMFEEVKAILCGNSIIAAAIEVEEFIGVRVAWRDNRDPFTQEDLNIMQCIGECPKGCGPGGE